MNLKLTKKQESEVLKAYNAYWDAYLHGDWRKNASFLDDNIYMVGTTAQEVYHNKKQATQFFRDTAKEVKGKIQFRNRKQVVVPADSNVLVNEELDLFIKTGKEWSFYSRVRISSVMRQDGKGWKFIQQHGSVPDLRTQEGETIAFDKISQENIQLRDAVNRRTIELQQKNQELAVESALERVRTVAMAMKKPEDMLDICRVISKELEGLGLREIRNVQTVIIDQHKAIYLNYEYYRLQKKTFITPIPYKENRKINRFVQQILKDPEGFYTSTKKGTELTEWLKYQEQSGQFVDPHLRKSKSLHYYFYSIGPGALGVSTYAPLNKEEIICFKRFRNVFQLSYQRFFDIQIAEAQAREAMIEASLERMRAKAMSMRKPDELLNAADLLHKELSHLGIDSMNVSYALVDLEKNVDLYYSANPIDGSIIPFPFIFPHNETETMRSILSSWQKKDPFNVIELNEKATIKHQTYIGKHIKQQFAKSDIPFSIDEFLARSPKKAVLSTFNFSKGYLFHIGGARLTKIQEDIMLRATRVFDQTYRRFLDLQKAEAQAKESQIQLALERVRARTMAMHKSEELSDVVALLYKQFVELDFGLYQILISIINTEKNRIEWWSRGFQDTEVPVCYIIPFVDHPFPNMQMQKWRSGEIYHAHVLEGELKRSWEKYLFTQTDLKNFPGKIKKQMQGIERVYLSDAFMKHGVLQAAGPSPLSPDKADILIRFAKVLDQAYTRMNDLQKAEAQAREARIEAALEKVRSRSLAMHRADELGDVITVIVDKLKELDFSVKDGVALITYIEGSKDLLEYMENPGFPSALKFYLPYFEHPILINLWKAKEQGIDFIATKYTADENRSFLEHIFQHTDYKHTPQQIKDFSLSARSYSNYIAFQKNTSIFINDYSEKPLTELEIDILKRFSKVFEQSYIRFLDLQKAEAQAREAKIEAALEKVRGRAMAMQKSDELQELITTVYKELTKLDLVLDRCFISIFDPASLGSTWWMAAPETTTGVMGLFMKYHESPPYLAHLKAWEERQAKWQYILEGDVKKKWDDYIFKETEFSLVPPDVIENMKAQQKVYLNASYNAFGCLSLATLHPLSEEQFDVMIRFAKVFDLTYTRFNDLKQAEAQAREARIEAALEKVRGRAMAMQKSDELQALIGTVSAELTKLELVMERCFIAIFDPVTRGCTWWMASSETDGGLIGLFMQYHEYPPYLAYLEGWDKREVKWQYILEGKIKKDWDEFIFQETEFSLLPEVAISNMKAPGKVFLNASFNAFGCLTLATLEPLTEDQSDILIRMARVFDLTYTRFNDLKQAEAQAREARIETALEKVRSRTMAMQKSDELPEAAIQLFKQVQLLDVPAWAAGYCIWDEDKQGITLWMSSEGILEPPFHAPTTEDPSFIHFREAWERGESFFVEEIGGEELVEHYKYMRRLPTVGKILDSIIEAGHPLPTFQIFHLAYFSKGFLLYITYQPVPQAHDIFRRFGKVFEQTYGRFLDLQRAEAQAKEAQVEAALERVRSKTMAMHNSQDVAETVSTLFNQLLKLGVRIYRCGIGIMDESGTIELWTARPGVEEKADLIIGYLDMNSHPLFQGAYEGWKNKDETFCYELKGDDVIEYYTALNSQPNYQVNYELDKLPAQLFHNDFYFNEGTLFVFSLEQLSADESAVLKRFTAVFGQTYTRFLDLQRAEAQTREAQIETSLERVRSKAMAMHSSEELATTISTFYHEIEQLSITPIRCGVAIVDKETKIAELATMNTTESGESVVVMGHIKMEGHRILEEAFAHWLEQKEYHATLRGPEIREYYKVLRPQIEFPDYPHDEVQYGYYFMFREGDVYAWTEKPLTEEQLKIYRRFTTVLSLTFKRYKDLQHAEAQARVANIEVALERVRAKALAMQEPEELKDVAQVLRNEMGALGVEELETASIYIHEKDSANAECWYALKDPKDGSRKMVADQFHLKLDDTWVGQEMKKFYQSNEKQTSIVMKGTQRKEWIDYCYKHSPVFSGYYGETIPDRTYHLYKFSHGYIGAAAPGDISAESWRLLSRAASVFSLAYSRFKDLTQARYDLQRLKEEKQRAESALSELKSTQTQLIQAEKMASLGELTAGIAHEIQNPLNFVNNFSELSNELLEEMKAELLKENREDAMQIIENVKQNLEKINFHGKRADAIVKNMLQHSRSSSGQKELTDINSLADEYLRLAYHGYRAKDKSFNSRFETHLDEKLEKINVVPQEMGRVILNLINNAFYAVWEKKKKNLPGYEPLVKVSTIQSNGRTEISIRDNGIGIPKQVLNKIFQPFFTTKPTGQGTGLGLSLSYDIITKGHGGELKVTTLEGEGTEFVIQLPNSDWQR